MAGRSVVLINSNRMLPPVAPLALDYIAASLESARVPVRMIDLTFEPDADAAIRRCLEEADPIAVGITFRNTDDCFWPSGEWFVPHLRQLVTTVRQYTDAPIVLGGCGFSIYPARILSYCDADLGIVGDGEETFTELVRRIDQGRDYHDLPGLAYRRNDGRIRVNRPAYPGRLNVPPARGIVDNSRYFAEGGMGNVESKRGCPNRCIYCADPLAKGHLTRCRPPGQVADEIASLLRQGIDVLHFCDSEFNIPPDHAEAVCDELISRGLGSRIRWYCYATVHPFSADLALKMRRAGCVGINFGIDSGCDRMLDRLGRNYRREAISHAVRCCRRAGITVMLDLLIGGPGEDAGSVAETINFVKTLDPDRAGAATGVRIYPGTQIAEIVRRQGPIEQNPNLRGCVANNDDFFQPVFYIDRNLGDDPAGLVCDLIGDDDRFFRPAGTRSATDHNYNENVILKEAIAQGYRGAFWDILRRVSTGQPPP